jgi:hypothetical protein
VQVLVKYRFNLPRRCPTYPIFDLEGIADTVADRGLKYSVD